MSTLTPAGCPLESSISNGGEANSIPITNSFLPARKIETSMLKMATSRIGSFTKRISIPHRSRFQSWIVLGGARFPAQRQGGPILGSGLNDQHLPRQMLIVQT